MDFKREVLNIFDTRRVFKIIGDTVPNPTGFRHRLPMGELGVLNGFNLEGYPIVENSKGTIYTVNNEDLEEIE